MATFNSFNLYQDFIVLNNITCFQHNVNTIKHKHIISIEKTKIYSIPWLIFGVFLILAARGYDVGVVVLGIGITAYQVISMFITVILIRVSSYTYSSKYCGDTDYTALTQWFNSVHDSNIQMMPASV